MRNNKGQFIKGNIPWSKTHKMIAWNKGIECPNISERQKGEKNHEWKGGCTQKGRYTKRLEKKAGKERPETCEVCGDNGRICFDHDHKTGKFRGWICHRCNAVLGFVKDNSDLLTDLAKYLKK